MRIAHTAVPRLKLGVLVAFIVGCALMFGYLWVNMGGRLPLITQDGYQVSFVSKDVDNLVYDSDVRLAGVQVGKVRQLGTDSGEAEVVIQIDDPGAFPLHEGATIHLRSKSLIEETYVEVVDGSGAELPSGATLPVDAVAPSVQLDDLLASLDAETRDDLGESLRSLGRATKGTSGSLEGTMRGLGLLGREGHDALDALEAQSQDLRRLVVQANDVMGALDVNDGRIVDLVEASDLLTASISGQQADLEQSVRQLPELLGTIGEASDSLDALSADLRPISAGLRTAAPDLSAALKELPETTKDLRGLVPDLDRALSRAPSTLDRVPRFADRVVDVIPTVRTTLADVNPMLAYMKPYGPDIASFFANWVAMMQQSDANGHFLRIFMIYNEQSIKGNPIPTNSGALDKSNAYPAPGQASDPQPFTGDYPRVERDRR